MKIKISYQTLLLPPPFAFGYTLDLVINEESLNVLFELEFLNRDTISEDEILEEGYSLDDDFSWSGELGKAWCDELDSLKAIELEPNSSDENIWMHFTIGEGNEIKSGMTKDTSLWDFKIQELIQAIYEKSKRELPLDVKLKHRSGDQILDLNVKGSFETLTAKVNGKNVQWRKMQEAMSHVFSADITQEGSKKPKEDGLWIDMNGDKVFYLLELKKQELSEIIKVLRVS